MRQWHQTDRGDHNSVNCADIITQSLLGQGDVRRYQRHNSVPLILGPRSLPVPCTKTLHDTSQITTMQTRTAYFTHSRQSWQRIHARLFGSAHSINSSTEQTFIYFCYQLHQNYIQQRCLIKKSNKYKECTYWWTVDYIWFQDYQLQHLCKDWFNRKMSIKPK